MARPSTIVNRKDVSPLGRTHADKYAFEGRPLGLSAGSKQLGCTHYTVPPEKMAFPAHIHHAIEEAMYILSGSGSLRLGSEWHPVEPGDYIALHASGPAHQIRNTGNGPLEYLCFSTISPADVVEYPDSGKLMASAGTWNAPILRGIYKKDAQVDYFDGE